ncbi:MAG: hypothetical protein NTW75_09970 [Planctomycetales bacterium]|jgi:hypothetical protein|nr:hypothetical protein [Planctomycetales bacterium]
MFDPLGLADAEQINALHAFGFGGRWCDIATATHRSTERATTWRQKAAQSRFDSPHWLAKSGGIDTP